MLGEIGRVARAETPTHAHLRGRLVAVAIATLVVDVLATLAVFHLERDAAGTEIHTLDDAFFWTTYQLLTVSSQFPNPLTTGGRIVNVFLELYGITVVAALAGSFGAFFHRRGIERDPPATT